MNVSTVAGAATECGVYSDAVGAAARFVSADDLAAGDSLVYVADDTTIRVVDPATGAVARLAGQPASPSTSTEDRRSPGSANCVGSPMGSRSVRLRWVPRFRRVTLDGVVTTLAGDPAADLWWSVAPVDGSSQLARLNPDRLIVTAPGRVVFVDRRGSVREVTDGGQVTTTAGWSSLMMPAGQRGFSVHHSSTAVAMGVPLGIAPLSSARTGAAVISARTKPYGVPYVEAAWPGDATEGDGYGAAVSFVGDRAIALGPSNGPLWDVPGSSGQPLPSEDEVVEPVVLFWQPRGTLWKQWTPLPVPDVTEDSGYGSALASLGTLLAVGAPRADAGVVFVQDLSFVDGDSDTLPDLWEIEFGLDPTSAEGADGATGDPDGDGLTNVQEFAAQSHPRGSPAFTNYFAEGATSTFFDTEFAIANPGQAEARVLLRFLSSSGHVTTHMETVAARSRRTVVVSAVPGMAASEFATVVESDQPVAVDRLMSWRAESRPEDGPLLPSQLVYGSHGQGGLPAPATHWFLAEGATLTGFRLVLPGAEPGRPRRRRARAVPVGRRRPARAHVSRGRPQPVQHLGQPGGDPAPLGPAPARRPRTVRGDHVDERRAPARRAGDVPHTARSGRCARPSIRGGPRERWRDGCGHGVVPRGGGHRRAVRPVRPNRESRRGRCGGRGHVFPRGRIDPRQALLRPGRSPLHHLGRPRGRGIGGRGRVDHHPLDQRCPSGRRARHVVVGIPTTAAWTEAHAGPGATSPGTEWVAAAGRVQRGVPGEPDTATYYLVANPGDAEAWVFVDVLFEDGTPPGSYSVTVPAHSRLNVVPTPSFEDYSGNGTILIPSGARRFSAVFRTSSPSTPIVVEWAIYSDALGVPWAAGASALATKVR